MSRLTEMASLEYLIAHAQAHAPENLLALQVRLQHIFETIQYGGGVVVVETLHPDLGRVRFRVVMERGGRGTWGGSG